MTRARVASALKHILRGQVIFFAGWTLGGLYVATLLTVPKLLGYVSRLM